ncbi:MAG: SDR family oxidoreductase [Anaerolineae bacterium]
MQGKTIVLTGAAKGIGRATALRLAKAGHTVFAGVRKLEDGDSLRADQSSIRPILLDVTHVEQIAAAVETVRAYVGDRGLDALINNAGVAVASPLEFLPIDDFRKQIEVNLTAQLAVTQAFIPYLRAARGRIINVTSIGGRVAGKMLGAYHASKFAFEALTDTLRLELAPWGMEVVAIEPGEIATPIWETGAQMFAAMLTRMPPQVMDLYGTEIRQTETRAASGGTGGSPADAVAQVIERAILAARPRTRYTVGMDARIADTVIRRLPDRLRDRLMGSR